jgi:dTDP-L-rhamnose 4-epimerase
MNNILITGGAGFIGSKTALKLIEKGYKVRILDNLSPQIHGENADISPELMGKVEFIKGDVRSKEDWKKAIENQDAVIHLAAETGTGQSMYEIHKYTDVNIGGTANLLDVLTNEKHTIKKVIVASSRAIYGEGKYICNEHGVVYPTQRIEDNMKIGDFECKCPICGNEVQLVATDEETKIHPTSIYGITKQNQEQMVLVTCESIGIPAVVFRYQNVYGPGQSLSNPYTGILSIFSTRIKNGNDINIFEDGRESRDFVYIDDIADATILGLEKEEANFEVFNVGSGYQTDVMTVANTLKNAYKSNINITISGNYRLGDIRHNYSDLTKIKEKLKFEPVYDFKAGILKFVQWVEKQKITEDRYDQSIKEMEEKGLYK